MTGIYMRAKRGGKWQSLDIADLTKEELAEAFKDADKERVLMFFSAVTQWMRDNLVAVSEFAGTNENATPLGGASKVER